MNELVRRKKIPRQRHERHAARETNSRLEGNVTLILNQLVRSRVISPVAAPRRPRTAIQDELDAEVDVVPFPVAIDLDPVHETGDRAVGPAAAAVLGDVLVELLCQVRLAVDIVPVPIVGDVLLDEVAAMLLLS